MGSLYTIWPRFVSLPSRCQNKSAAVAERLTTTIIGSYFLIRIPRKGLVQAGNISVGIYIDVEAAQGSSQARHQQHTPGYDHKKPGTG